MKSQKFSVWYILILIYTVCVFAANGRLLFSWILSAENADLSTAASSIGLLLLLIGVVVYLFSEKWGWILFSVYCAYVIFDACFGIAGMMDGNTRGDYLFRPGMTRIKYLGYYVSFLAAGGVVFWLIFRHLKEMYRFNTVQLIYLLISGLALAFLYDYLLAEEWAHAG